MLLGKKIAEYPTGYRAFSRQVLETVPFRDNSDVVSVDNQMLAQIFCAGSPLTEITGPVGYFPEASAINLGGAWPQTAPQPPRPSALAHED